MASPSRLRRLTYSRIGRLSSLRCTGSDPARAMQAGNAKSARGERAWHRDASQRLDHNPGAGGGAEEQGRREEQSQPIVERVAPQHGCHHC